MWGQQKKKYYSLYTVCFLVMCLLVFLPFLSAGKSFIWGASVEDGLSQHYESLAYWGCYLRRLFSNVIKGRFYLPMWSMSIGYGADILSSLNYYAIGDPLNLLYGFVPARYTETMYNFMILFRMYLAGLSFLLYCRKMHRNQFASVAGALVYIFGGFVFRFGIRHPFFINPMIYFPLLCLGIEKIYKKERPYLLIGAVFLSAVSNYYFLYMLTLFAVFYALIRFFSYYPVNRWRYFFITLGRFAGFYAVGILLSAVILLPAVIGFLGNGRMGHGQSITSLLGYSVRYYVMFVENFVSYGNSGYGTNTGFLPLAGICVLFLFFSRRMRHRKYRVAVYGCLIFLCFPIFGYAFNGFSYAANRWSFVFGFIVALLVSEVLPRLFLMSKKQRIGILAGIGIYTLIGTVAYFVEPSTFKNPGFYISVLLLLVFYLLFLLFEIKGIDYKNRKAKIALMVLLFISGAVHGYYRFGTSQHGYVNEFVSRGRAYGILTNDGLERVRKTIGNSLCRVDDVTMKYKNYGLLAGLNTVSGYYSITSGNISSTINSYETLGMQYADKYQGLDQRTGLLSLSGVRYVLHTEQISYETAPEGENGENSISASEALGKTPISEDLKLLWTDGNTSIYENPYALPIGYTYDSYVTKKQYNALNGVGREHQLLVSAVLDQNISTLPHASAAKETVTEMVPFSGKEVSSPEGKSFSVLKIKKKPGEKTYLYIKGLNYDGITGNFSSIALRGKGKVRGIDVQDGEYQKKIHVQDDTSDYYFGRHDYILPIDGSTDENGNVEVILKFLSEGKYTVDKAYVITTDQKEALGDLKKLQSHALHHIQYKDNDFSGKINVDRNRLLCIQIPYSKGWTGWVDGKKAKILKVNGMYMGLILKPGNHKIQLHYQTPGLALGAGISLSGVVLLLLYGWIRRKYL